MFDSPRFAQLCAAAERGQPALTIELARLHLADEPDDVRAMVYLSSALCDLARYDEAHAICDRKLALLPPESHAPTWRALGQLEASRSNVAAAEVWFHRTIEARPLDATAYIFLGGMLAKAGRLEEAEHWHRLATGCVEGCIDEAYLNLGFVLRARGEYLEALECFREAIRRDPDYADAHEALVDVEQVLFNFPLA